MESSSRGAKRRGDPESLRYVPLDCFALLAMMMWTASPFGVKAPEVVGERPRRGEAVHERVYQNWGRPEQGIFPGPCDRTRRVSRGDAETEPGEVPEFLCRDCAEPD